MLISDEYRQLNAELHEKNDAYGNEYAYRWVKPLNDLTWEFETFDVLDYGCGKALLSKLMTKMCLKNYDPSIPKYAATPEPADIVVCTDVMEHIEPDHLDAVIDDLKRVTKRALLLNISLQPALKMLADGRNAHLIVEDIDFWCTKFLPHFDLYSISGMNGSEVTMILYARRTH